jgi:beta-lactamase class A
MAFAVTPAFARRPAPKPSPTPTAIPTAAPLTAEERVARLRAQIAAMARDAPGRLGVTIVDTSLGTHVAIHGDDAFPLASTGKLAIALTAFRRADQHRFNLDDRVSITSTYWRLIRAMLVENDNTASDFVLRTVGGPSAVQGVLDRLGFRGFSIRKTEAELASDTRAGRTFARGGDNAATPDAVAALLQGITEQRMLHEDSTYEMMTMLEAARTSPNRLRAGLPSGTVLAHASGTSATIDGVTDATDDAGVFTLPDGRRIVVVVFLSASPADSTTRDAILAHVARAAYEAFGP